MKIEELTKEIKKIPSKPGIYIFKSPKHKPLYVGKAGNIKSRLRYYLKTDDVRIKKMVASASVLDFEETDSDIEALIRESQLIKNWRPAFNIVLRDDKQYFFVGFTKENFPKLFLTHQPKLFEDAELIGPFTDGAVLKSVLRFLRGIFPYCTCKKLHNNFCLNYHIGKCLGFCCLKNPELRIKNGELRNYRKNIKAVKEILGGKRGRLIKDLEKEMQKFAKQGDLEEAIKTRDKLGKLKRIFENAQIIKNWKLKIGNSGEGYLPTLQKLEQIFRLTNIPRRIEGYDISNIQGANATGSMVVFENGLPGKNHYRKFKIKTKSTPDDTFMLNELLQRRFNHPEWAFPDLILIDGGKGQLHTARNVIKILDFKIPIISLAKGKYEIFSTTLEKPISMAKLPADVRNLIKHVDSEAHRFAIGYYRKLHRRSL